MPAPKVVLASQYQSDTQSRSLRLSDARTDIPDTVPVKESVYVPSLLILRVRRNPEITAMIVQAISIYVIGVL